MKHTLLTLIAVFGTAILSAQSFSDAGEYMSYFSEQYDAVAKDQWDYTRLVARGKGAKRIENKRQKLLSTTKQAEQNIKRMKGFEGDGSLRDTVAGYFSLAYKVLDEDYAEIMDLEEVAEQSYDGMEALILARQIANDKLEAANKHVIQAQKTFAASHNITLLEERDELFENLEKAGEVFDYYDRLYLIFFKSHKQEAYMVEAMNKGDVAGLEQNKSALEAAAQEGLTKLKASENKAFKSDAQLRIACKKVLDFHLEEASEKMQIIIDFYVNKENFEKIQATMESKKKKDVTQEDVDKFNAAADAYNASVAEFNKVNEELNTDRTKMLEGWNVSVEKFLDRHVPQ